MSGSPNNTTISIRERNDEFRSTFTGGRVLMTPGVTELSENTRQQLFRAVKTFDDFTRDNDPHGEHDFGEIELEDVTYFFKIDYYAPDMRSGVENAALPETARVLTIMRADEY